MMTRVKRLLDRHPEWTYNPSTGRMECRQRPNFEVDERLLDRLSKMFSPEAIAQVLCSCRTQADVEELAEAADDAAADHATRKIHKQTGEANVRQQ